MSSPYLYHQTGHEGTITIVNLAAYSNPAVFLFATKEDYLRWIADPEFRPRERIVGIADSKEGTYRWNLRSVVETDQTVYAYQFATPQPYHDTTYSVWAIVVYKDHKNVITNNTYLNYLWESIRAYRV